MKGEVVHARCEKMAEYFEDAMANPNCRHFWSTLAECVHVATDPDSGGGGGGGKEQWQPDVPRFSSSLRVMIEEEERRSSGTPAVYVGLWLCPIFGSRHVVFCLRCKALTVCFTRDALTGCAVL
jgi:hypothetical protein